MRFLIGFVVLVALAVAACADDACTASLDSFWLCSDGCPSYEEAARISESVDTGECLDFQYVFIGGFSVVEDIGGISMPFNTSGMYRGSIDIDGNVSIKIYKDK